MSLAHSPSVVRDGLITYLDVLNPVSSVTSVAAYDLFSMSTSTLFNSPSVISGALTFNGTNQYTRSPNLYDLIVTDSLTIDVWFNTSTSNGVVVDEIGSNDGGATFAWHDSQIEVVSSVLKVRVWQISSINVGSCSSNAWHHAALVYNTSNSTLYGWLDGQKSATTVVAPRTAPKSNGYGKIHYALGLADTTNNGSGAYFSGSIGPLKVYNRNLSDQEVYQNFSALRGRFGL